MPEEQQFINGSQLLSANIMNRLQLKALMLSVITEIKCGFALPNSKGIKREFKKLVGLPDNASNKRVLDEIERVYSENGILDDYQRTFNKFFKQ